MIGDGHDFLVSNSMKLDFPNSVLSGFSGIGVEERASRLRDRAELLGNKLEGVLWIKFSSYYENGVVRLIVASVEVLQALNRDILNIGACSDGGFSVVMPEICGGEDSLF